LPPLGWAVGVTRCGSCHWMVVAETQEWDRSLSPLCSVIL
jgi:hypothetical protein